jgi:3-oxoacyl-[acyl-carrier protein] reductase
VSDLVLITGASSDIGLSLIERLAGLPDPPVILAHCHTGADRVERVRGSLKAGSIHVLHADFSSEDSVGEMVEGLTGKFGVPNQIVHLPGLKLIYERFAKFDWKHFERDLRVQLYSAIILLKRLMPEMAKMPRARVVFVLSSVTRGVPPKYMSMYTIVKHAQLGLMRALASEYAAAGINVNAVTPGMVETRFLDNLPELAKPEDVAGAIEFLLSDRAGYITGIEIPVTGGNVY